LPGKKIERGKRTKQSRRRHRHLPRHQYACRPGSPPRIYAARTRVAEAASPGASRRGCRTSGLVCSSSRWRAGEAVRIFRGDVADIGAPDRSTYCRVCASLATNYERLKVLGWCS